MGGETWSENIFFLSDILFERPHVGIRISNLNFKISISSVKTYSFKHTYLNMDVFSKWVNEYRSFYKQMDAH